MIPMMVDVLAATGTGEPREQLHEHVEEFVMRLNGKQTIYQMMQLAEEVKAHRRHAAIRWSISTNITTCCGSRSAIVWHRSRRARTARRSDRARLAPPARAIARPRAELVPGLGHRFEDVRDELHVLGLSEFFGQHVYGALDDYRSFSKAMIIERIIADMNVQGHQLLAFGDGFVEIEEHAKPGAWPWAWPATRRRATASTPGNVDG